MNFTELLEELRKTDEVTLLELLGITSEDIIDGWLDRVVEHEGKIRRRLAEEEL